MKIDLDLRGLGRKDLRIAVVGATGMVGEKMLAVLDETGVELSQLVLVASSRSAGKTLTWRGAEYPIVSMQEAVEACVHIALFAADADTAREFAPQFARSGAYVIDNSSAFRMQEGIPLVVPEVNIDILRVQDHIIANPNCSTIQMVVALQPLHRAFGLRRVVVSTYQAVSGTGVRAVQQYKEERKGEQATDPAYWHPIFENCLPQCDDFAAEGYTKEEMKLVNETRKIMQLPHLQVAATAVRVPLLVGHSESINAEFEQEIDIASARQLWEKSPSIVLQDEPENNLYPMPMRVAGNHEVFVGRLRKDLFLPNALHFWCVADNLLKGAATNAVQIARHLLLKNFC